MSSLNIYAWLSMIHGNLASICQHLLPYDCLLPSDCFHLSLPSHSSLIFHKTNHHMHSWHGLALRSYHVETRCGMWWKMRQWGF